MSNDIAPACTESCLPFCCRNVSMEGQHGANEEVPYMVQNAGAMCLIAVDHLLQVKSAPTSCVESKCRMGATRIAQADMS